MLRQLVLKDRVVTMDALLTQRHVAQTIVDEGGDYVMTVKENQPQLRADITLILRPWSTPDPLDSIEAPRHSVFD